MLSESLVICSQKWQSELELSISQKRAVVEGSQNDIQSGYMTFHAEVFNYSGHCSDLLELLSCLVELFLSQALMKLYISVMVFEDLCLRIRRFFLKTVFSGLEQLHLNLVLKLKDKEKSVENRRTIPMIVHWFFQCSFTVSCIRCDLGSIC